MYVTFEFTACVILIFVALFASFLGITWPRFVWRAFYPLARRPGLALLTVGTTSLVVNLAAGYYRGIPEPSTTDEFSYLLAADTFSQGRLTNPTHPYWEHFVAAQIIHQPSYQSKYAPGQGLVLAFGQAVFGYPIAGVWISLTVASVAVCWMLQAWLPSRWALLGGLITATHVGIADWWGQTYWGGAVAMTGGALLFGGARRLVRDGKTWNGWMIGLGLAMLANSRPYEGLLASLPVAALTIGWLFRQLWSSASRSAWHPFYAIITLLVINFVVMGYYNLRVSGHPLRLPYQHTIERSASEIILVSPKISRVHRYLEKLKILWQFYVRLLLLPPLLMFPWMLRNPWIGFASLTCCIVLLGFVLAGALGFPHYTAPVTCLIFLILLQGMRHLCHVRIEGRPMGHVLVPLLAISLILSPIAFFSCQEQWYPQPDCGRLKTAILKHLNSLPGQHLVVVQYAPQVQHINEWVYNRAKIDQADVVWARSLDQKKDQALLNYYAHRYAWLLRDDALPIRLVPHPASQHSVALPPFPPRDPAQQDLPPL